jgi:hypothetical protein
MGLVDWFHQDTNVEIKGVNSIGGSYDFERIITGLEILITLIIIVLLYIIISKIFRHWKRNKQELKVLRSFRRKNHGKKPETSGV